MPKKLRRLFSKLADARERHRERHRPSGFGFAIADRVGFLDTVRWDDLTRSASFFLQRPFLETLEEAGPENIEPRYALIFEAGRPVAALVAQIVTVSGERMLKAKNASSSPGSVPKLLKRAWLSPA